MEQWEMEHFGEQQETPAWARGKVLNERAFCQDFLRTCPVQYFEGAFYGCDGWVPEQEIRRRIFDLMGGHVTSGMAQKTNKLLEALKLFCHADAMRLEETLIHCENGTYNLMKDTFTEKKQVCRCRLPVRFNRDCGEPVQWLKFLGELLYEEDIETLQQYMGYCLIPCTYAQKMLLIIGNGGEGKSRIGVVLSALLGQYMMNGSLAKLENSPFSRADLQGRLLLVDDDLQLEALTSTNNIKALVTAEQPMDLERKGQQSYQARVYCRFIGFGNGHLRSLHDRSYGFFRRQVILTTRPRPRDRRDDPYLAKRIVRDELEAVFMWALEGLLRLIGSNMQLYISPRARETLQSVESEGNNIPDFLSAGGYLRFDPKAEITARQLYQLYRDWCLDNETFCLSSKSFSSWMIQNGRNYDLSYSNNIHAGSGRYVRGFRGLREIK